MRAVLEERRVLGGCRSCPAVPSYCCTYVYGCAAAAAWLFKCDCLRIPATPPSPPPPLFCSVLCARLPPKLCTTAVVAAATAAIAAGAAAAAVVRASLSAVSDLASQLVAGLGLDVVGPATGRGDERGGGGEEKEGEEEEEEDEEEVGFGGLRLGGADDREDGVKALMRAIRKEEKNGRSADKVSRSCRYSFFYYSSFFPCRFRAVFL